MGYMFIPGVILLTGAIVEFGCSVDWFFAASAVAAAAAGFPIAYLLTHELGQLAKQPVDLCIVYSDGAVLVDGRLIEGQCHSNFRFEYRYYTSSGGQHADAGYSELDFVVLENDVETRFELLSQTADWALKHAKKCRNYLASRLTGK